VDNDKDHESTPAVAAARDEAPPAVASDQAEPSVADGLKAAPADKSWLEMMTVRDETPGFWRRNNG
jgi:hypothetical protein